MKPMLAGQFVQDQIKKQLPMYIQPKLDGIRVFINDGVAYTRSLKPVRAEWVQQWVREHAYRLQGIDGEIMCGSPTAEDVYRRTNSSIMSFDKPDDFKIHAFDYWNQDVSFNERLEMLRCTTPCPHLRTVETSLVKTVEEIMEINQYFLDIGYEGSILRSPQSFYKFGRGTPTKGELIKLKKFKDKEAVVTGFVELMHNDNVLMTNELGYAERSSHKENLRGGNMLGSLLIKGKLPDGRSYKGRVGSGFTQAQRVEIWENQDKYLNKLVKIKYFEGGIKEAPRFPIFLDFRDNDDTSTTAENNNVQMSLF